MTKRLEYQFKLGWHQLDFVKIFSKIELMPAKLEPLLQSLSHLK